MSENNKPVVESFQLDHTKVKAPYVRYIEHRLLAVRVPHRIPPADLGRALHRGRGPRAQGIPGIHRERGHLGGRARHLTMRKMRTN